MSIVKCETCDENIDLDFEDADYVSGKGYFHVDCEETPKDTEDMTNKEIEMEITHLEHADVMRKDEKKRWRELKEERRKRE